MSSVKLYDNLLKKKKRIYGKFSLSISVCVHV